MLLKFEDTLTGFKLGEQVQIRNENEALEETFRDYMPEANVVINKDSEIESYSQEFAGRNVVGGLDWWSKTVKGLGCKGLYTVPELGLEDVPFHEVIKAVKDYYSKVFS